MTSRYGATELKDWVARAFGAAGVPIEHADLAASVIIRTSLRGIDTHGIVRVPDYVDRLLSGVVDPEGHPTSELEAGALHVDGRGALGQIVGTRAIEAAIVAVRDTASVPVFISNSGHMGALGMFALQAAEAGFVALICQATPPIMAPPGASRAAIGNNPLAFAIPLKGLPPVVFDMAASTVARGRVVAAVRDGRKIPLDWAIGPDGAPTDDPLSALAGSMLPVAGHKGLGLAMMVQCLAASFGRSPHRPGGHGSAHRGGSAGNVSAFAMVLNPSLVSGRDSFVDRTEEWFEAFAGAFPNVPRYPGSAGAEHEAERLATGVPVPGPVLEALKAMSRQLGVEDSFGEPCSPA